MARKKTVNPAAIRSKLSELLAESPHDAAEREVWIDRVLDTASDPLETLLDRISALEEENKRLHESETAPVDATRTAHISDESLGRTNERFRIATGSAGMVVFEQDTDLVYSWEYNIHAFLGRESLGMKDSDLFPEDEAAELSKLKQKVLDSGQGSRQLVWVTINGEKSCFDLLLEPVRSADGAVNRVLGAAVDVTAQRRLLDENERQRRSLETILTVAPTGTAVVVAPEMRFVLANDSYRAATPHPEIDPVGRRLDEVWKVEEGYQEASLLAPVIEDHASISLERVQRRYPDGALRSFSMHSRPISWGNQRAAVLVTWETTELENALVAAREAALEAHHRAAEAEEGRRTLDALMDYIPEGVVITTAQDLRVLYASKYAAGMLGKSRRQVEGRQFYDVVEPWEVLRKDGQLSINSVDNPAIRAVRDGEVVFDEEMVMEQGHQRINLLCNAGPIRDVDGHVFGSVITVRDISERKREEAHQRFLGELGKAVATFRSVKEVKEEISTLLGEYLGADWCLISEQDEISAQHMIRYDYHAGQESLSGEYSPTMFPAPLSNRLRRGRAAAVSDTLLDPLMAGPRDSSILYEAIRGILSVPWTYSAGGQLGTLTVLSHKPRTWQSDEIYLVQAVADLTRLALHNVRLLNGLQEFRTRFEVALQNAPITVFSTDQDLKITWIFNPRWGTSLEQMRSEFPPKFSQIIKDPRFRNLQRNVLSKGKGQQREFEFTVGEEKFSHNITVEPLRAVSGDIIGLAVSVMETTEMRRMEAESTRSQAYIEVQHRLIDERERERVRIARELHDGPLQDLIAANFSLVEAMDINEKEPRLTKMRAIRDMLHGQIHELRRFCNDLRPPVLAPFGLEKTIRSHVESWRDIYPWLKVNLHLYRDGQQLSEDMRMTLYRIYQELMTNIVRHANANQATVRFSMEDKRVLLEVEDNGVGFAMPDDWVEMARGGHLGLVGLRERVEMSGGTVAIDSKEGEGTRVRVMLPLAEEE